MKYPRRGRDSQTNWPLGGCGGPTASIRVNPRSRHSCSSAVTSLNGSVRWVMKKVTDVAGIQPLTQASTKRKATCARTGAIYWCGLTSAFCCAACVAQRAEGVGQQRAVSHQHVLPRGLNRKRGRSANCLIDGNILHEGGTSALRWDDDNADSVRRSEDKECTRQTRRRE